MTSVTTLVCSSEGSEGVNLLLLDYFCSRFWFDKATTHLHTGAATSLSPAYKDVKNVLVLTNPESKNLGAVLEQAHKAMHAEGSLFVVSSSGENKGTGEAEESAIKRAIVVAGFTGTEEEAKTSVPATLLSTNDSEVVCFKASRPQWQQGAKQGIRMKLKKKASKKTKTATESSSKDEVLQVWKLDANEANDLIDEDDVLVDDIQLPAMEIDEAMESAVKPKRKACKNCSCGRKEMEEAEEKAAANQSTADNKPAPPGANLTEDQIENPQSACGNCSLGDAFRCASCPYKGMPRFKLGEKIELSSMLLEADV
jgi:hypothetical protein